MQARPSLPLLLLAALAVAWSLVATGGSATGAAALLPILALLAPLLVRRYPGEARIARLRRARRPAIAPARAVNVRTPRAARRIGVRGGLLLARGLAVRPPPLHSAHA